MNIQTEINWSDLTYETQESIKENLLERFKDDPETMEAVNIQVHQNCVDDEIDFETLTKKELDWKIECVLDDMVEDIINKEFFGEITIGE